MSGLPFDHLALAEVAECERLAQRLVGQHNRRGRNGEHARLSELLAKRHRPLYDAAPAPDDAA